MLKIRIIKSKLQEVGHFSKLSLAGYADAENIIIHPDGSEEHELDDDRETRATQSRVVGEAVKNEDTKEHRN